MIAQFYNINTRKAYMSGHAFPEDCNYPEGSWVKVVSQSRVSLETLAKKAREIAAENNFKN